MHFRSLPTLATVQATPRAKLKKDLPTALDRKMAADTDDAAKLRIWATQVKARAEGRCRVCKVKTIATLALDPKRGEAHHIVSRSFKATRYDKRNGVWCCKKCHDRFKAHTLKVVGTPDQYFTLDDGLIRLLRDTGFEVEGLVEIQPPAGSTTTYDFVTLDWARQWPSEEVWRARKRG